MSFFGIKRSKNPNQKRRKRKRIKWQVHKKEVLKDHRSEKIGTRAFQAQKNVDKKWVSSERKRDCFSFFYVVQSKKGIILRYSVQSIFAETLLTDATLWRAVVVIFFSTLNAKDSCCWMLCNDRDNCCLGVIFYVKIVKIEAKQRLLLC